MRRNLAVIALVALLTTMMGGSALAQSYPISPSPSPSPTTPPDTGGGGGGGPITPPGPSPSPGPSASPDPGDEVIVNVSTPGADVTVKGKKWGKGVVVTIERHRGGNSSSGGTTPTGQSLRIATAADGSFTASFPALPEDSDGNTVFVVSGNDSDGDAHIVAAVPGKEVRSRGAVSDPEAAMEAAIAHSGVLAAAGGPFTVGSAITTTVLLLAGAGLLLVTRRRSRSAT